MTSTRSGLCCCAILIAALQPVLSISAAGETHSAGFWKTIKEHNFAVPAHESAGALALEIGDLAASTSPAPRGSSGDENLAAWIYRENFFTTEKLGAPRAK